MSSTVGMRDISGLTRGVPTPQAPLARVALALVAGGLHGLAFPDWSCWPFAFVALAPLVAAARGGGALAGAGLGWLAGTVASSIATTPWIAVATRAYFDHGGLAAVGFASLVGQVFHALPSAAFGALVPRLARLRTGGVRVLATAASWTALELVRGHAFTGAPWDLLGHALWAQPLWTQVASLGGVYAVSFVCAATGAALAELLCAPRRSGGALATAAVCVAVSVVFGAVRLAGEDDGGPHLRVALVQGNVPNAWRIDVARSDDALHAFVEATRPVLANDPALVVWPENAVSFLVAPNERFGIAVGALLRAAPGSAPFLLAGAPRYTQTAPGRVAFFNSAWLFDADGAARAVYDKRRLVPFAEYAPVARVPGLSWRFDAPGDYTPGTDAVVFREPAPFGVLVCYEAIYPALARDLARGGARFLVNVSNDAWFGTRAGLEQHLASAAFRAVESGRALVRATNTGVTALIGPSGRVLARFPADVRGAWTVEVPLRDATTPYARAGDVFGVGCVLGALWALRAAGRSGA